MGREKTLFAPLTKGAQRGYNSQAFDFEELICECAGIGRQASLRCLCSTGRVGSSPITRTTPQKKLHRCARVVELADSLDSGSSAHYGRAGSSPASRTKKSTDPNGVGTFFVPGEDKTGSRGSIRETPKIRAFARWIFGESNACEGEARSCPAITCAKRQTAIERERFNPRHSRNSVDGENTGT